MARPAAIQFELAEDERADLTRMARRRKTSHALATRARIVLAAGDGLSNTLICRTPGVSHPNAQT